MDIEFEKKTDLDYYRQEPAEVKLYDAFVRAKNQPVPVFAPELDIYNEAYRVCALLMVEQEPESALERYQFELTKSLCGKMAADLSLTLIWALLAVQKSIRDNANIFFTHLEPHIKQAPFYTEMKNGVDECKAENLLLDTDFLRDTNLHAQARKEARDAAVEFVMSIRSLAVPEWRDVYGELWEAILNSEVVAQYFYDPGKTGMPFNRTLVLNIVRQMAVAKIFSDDNATNISNCLKSSKQEWTDSWRRELYHVPEKLKVCKEVQRLILEFSPSK